jgi:hypothetical protein
MKQEYGTRVLYTLAFGRFIAFKSLIAVERFGVGCWEI